MSESETKAGAAAGPDAARDNEEHELEAEQESAEAMDAETSHGAEDHATTEGQPS
jgi:hypothetical protein